MIKFKKLRFKNLLSYGKSWTEYEFKTGITRVSGENGKGKSCLLEAMYYVLFGKPYRKINLPQIINNINKKELLIEVEFEINGSNFLIRRGMRPNIFEIFKNDELVPVPSKNRSYQVILEEDILHFNSAVFDQIGIKSSTRAVGFLTLSKNERRKIIETLLDIEVFSLMRELSKREINELESRVLSVSKDIEHLEISIEQELANIEKIREIKRRLEEEKKEQKKETEERLLAIELKRKKLTEGYERLEKYKKELESNKTIIESLKKDILKFKEEMSNLEVRKNIGIKKVEMFEITCSGCPKIKDIVGMEDIDGIEAKIAEISKKIKELILKREKSSANIEKAQKILVNKKILDHENNSLDVEEKRLKTRLEKSDDVGVEIDETLLIENKKKRERFRRDMEELKHVSKHYGVVRDMLSDDGIKTFVIKKFLPHINSFLKIYLQKFDADFIFEFDVEFNEVVKSRYKEEYSYNSFSEGQKKRIDLAILFTFLAFCKLKNRKSDTNIIFLDEIDSGLDAIGQNAMFDVLQEMTKEGKEVITISHSLGIEEEKIDRFIDVGFKGGFSTFMERT